MNAFQLNSVTPSLEYCFGIMCRILNRGQKDGSVALCAEFSTGAREMTQRPCLQNAQQGPERQLNGPCVQNGQQGPERWLSGLVCRMLNGYQGDGSIIKTAIALRKEMSLDPTTYIRWLIMPVTLD